MELEEIFRDSFLILGVGNSGRGDDGIGIYILEKLNTKYKLQCGSVPENFTGKIRRAGPKRILIIDAVDFGGKPGETILTEAERAEGLTLTTHSLPLSLLCRMLPESKIYILGIQPESFEKMTEKVKSSGDYIVKHLNSLV
ncbi:hydrogenase 3 maturation endopeptidase HyCI [Candidatus Micrarchaeota archaeon]|nr:hydrogenase 3 maturation endopeptidase HyCI [Candidatus Micrarchaeota archaeon]